MVNLDMVDIIHIGYHKTGTSWLQERVFYGNPKLNYVGNGCGWNEFNNTIRSLVHSSDLSFDKKSFKHAIDEFLGKNKSDLGLVNLLSSESLCGEWPHGRNSKFISDTLSSMYPTSKIVIGIRNYKDMIESSYRQYIRRGGVENLRNFLFDYYISDGYRNEKTILISCS